ncbi:MAG: tetratricopeptide repeat protein [Deltaproteobacteria bacterium]|nr:tetratricopeptide repeat protein [Deltaproteobacteria bacterium]TLN04786.1 MAG: tetratricopeptide repeat protein [bacterium]
MSSLPSSEKMFSALTSQIGLKMQMSTTMLSSGLSLYQKGKTDKAVAAFKQATAYAPDNVDAYNYLAKAYLKQGKSTEAINAYKISLSLDRSQSEIHTELGNVYFSEKRYSEAEASFKTAAQFDPADNLAPYTLGQLYLQTERYSEAENQFKKVIRMTPKDGNVYYALGTTYNKMERFDEAIAELEKAVSLKKDFALARFELGTSYIGLDRKEDAEGQLAILKDLDSSLYANLKQNLTYPKILAFNPANSTFNTFLGAVTPLSFLSADLLPPNSSKDFTMQFQFNSDMDASSVMNITNWSISKASGGEAGLYNNGVTLYPEKEAIISPLPKSVMYDASTYQATITFTIAQNPYGTAVIDPKHLVFKFSGTDIDGKKMDSAADQYNGFKGGVF